jgi:hypothetical protein
MLLHGDADVYKPNGEPLILLRRRAIPETLLAAAHDPLIVAAHKYGSYNRGKYAGLPRGTKTDGGVKRATSATVAVGEDGVMRCVMVESAVIGYFDRQGGRFPFCRATAFTAKEVEKWNHVVPLAQHVATQFKETMPTRYAVQEAATKKVLPQFTIAKTPFSTLTVNHNIAGRIHRDAGDFKEGFGCLSVLRKGQYRGGWLVFPAYRVAVDLGHGDIIFFNPHEWHGVTDFYDTEPGFERISVVYYLRKKMNECLAPKDEVARLRARQEIG